MQISDCRFQIAVCGPTPLLRLFWHERLDSNQDERGQSPLCYRITSHSSATKQSQIANRKSQIANPKSQIQNRKSPGAPTGFRSPYCSLTTSYDSQFTTGAFGGPRRAKKQCGACAFSHTGLARRTRTFNLHLRRVAPCPLGDRELWQQGYDSNVHRGG